MSKSLLKQSLSIVEESLSTKQNTKEKEVFKSKKGLKRNQQITHHPKKKPVIKVSVEDIRRERESKNKLVDENLKKLLTLSKPSSKIRNLKNIAKRARAGRYIIKKKEKVEQESLFTEEDFAAFERELAKTIT